MSYEIKLDIFEGPLDLLLFLIKKNEINIYDIPIAYITEQYLNYIKLMQELDINIASEYIVMAATLMQIKSRMLLPQHDVDDDAEQIDPRQELVDRLVQYQGVKRLASFFREMEQNRQEWFSRPGLEIDEVFDDTEVVLTNNVFDLLTAFSRVLRSLPEEYMHQVVLEHYTVEEKMHELLHLLVDNTSIRVSALFSRTKSRLELVAVFLAVLELARLGEVLIKQNSLFGEIELYRNEQVVLS